MLYNYDYNKQVYKKNEKENSGSQFAKRGPSPWQAGCQSAKTLLQQVAKG